jgi:PAS domain S-box-containing protein
VERFEQVINNITEVFWLTNPEKTEMIFISPGYERIWGRTREALRSNPESWLDALHPDDRAEITRRAKTEQTSASYDVEYRIIRPDGTLRWIRDRAFPVRNLAGEIYRVAGIAEDITEHKRMTGALAEANELTRAILEASPAGIAVSMRSSGSIVPLGSMPCTVSARPAAS